MIGDQKMGCGDERGRCSGGAYSCDVAGVLFWGQQVNDCNEIRFRNCEICFLGQDVPAWFLPVSEAYLRRRLYC